MEKFNQVKRESGGGDTSSVATSETGATSVQQEGWGNQLEFILTCVGFAVGLGNVWRFPYLAYQNGGGAFLIPYILILFLVGLPLFFMELCFGQFASLGPVTIWKMNPLFKGLGFAGITVSGYITMYFNIIISWTLYYFFTSLAGTLPWTTCCNSWNTDACLMMSNGTREICANFPNRSMNFNKSDMVTSSEEFYYNHVLELSGGIDQPGSFRWQLVLLLLLSWVIIFLVLLKGVSSLGKASYFISLFPYILLTIMLVRGATLEGAVEGIKFYITPKWEKLAEGKVWGEAATQIFYSLGVCMGSLIAMSSYNRFNNNVQRDSLIIPFVNCGTSIYSGFVIFSVLGYMANEKNVPISEVARDGPGLVFVVYPEGLSTMPIPRLWSALFFFMLTLIGYSSQFSMAEGVIMAILDEFSDTLRHGYRPMIFRACFCTFGFLLGLPMVTQGGFYIFTMVNDYCASFPLLIIAFFELLGIMVIYGYRRFADDVCLMLGHRPNIFFRVTWLFVTPLIIFATFIFLIIQHQPLSFDGVPYPGWAQSLAWLIAAFPISLIFLTMTWQYCKMGGFEVLKESVTPAKGWGPADPEDRLGRYALEDAKIWEHEMAIIQPSSKENFLLAYENIGFHEIDQTSSLPSYRSNEDQNVDEQLDSVSKNTPDGYANGSAVEYALTGPPPQFGEDWNIISSSVIDEQEGAKEGTGYAQAIYALVRPKSMKQTERKEEVKPDGTYEELRF